MAGGGGGSGSDGALAQLECSAYVWAAKEKSVKMHKEMVVDSDFEATPYFMDLAVMDGSVGAGVTSGGVMVLDVEGLRTRARFEGHRGAVWSVEWNKMDKTQLASGGWDGHVRIWDTRTAKATNTLEDKGDRPVRALAWDKDVLAAATGKAIKFYDARTWKVLGTFEHSHSEEVSGLLWHPSLELHLLSGGEDQLINLFDVTKEGEEGALQLSLRPDAGVEKIGLFGEGGAFVWTVTQTHMLQLFSLGTGKAVASFPSIRESCHDAHIPCDTLLSCFQAEPKRETAGSGEGEEKGDGVLWLLGSGVENGDGVLFSVHPDGVSPEAILPSHPTRGHRKGPIHCAAFIDNHSSPFPTILTGGEDGRLCLWNHPRSFSTSSSSSASVASRSEKMRFKSRRDRRKMRTKT